MAKSDFELSDFDKVMIRAAFDLKIASVKRALNNEPNAEIAKLRTREIGDYASLADRLILGHGGVV